MVLVAVVLLAVAGYFGWHQVQTLRGGAGPDERRYAVRQAWRRLFCCGLMVLVAGMLIGWLFLDGHYREMHSRAQAAPEEQRDKVLTDEDRDFVRFMGAYWGFVLLAVFTLLGLAAVDMWAIARQGLRQHRQLQADH